MIRNARGSLHRDSYWMKSVCGVNVLMSVLICHFVFSQHLLLKFQPAVVVAVEAFEVDNPQDSRPVAWPESTCRSAKMCKLNVTLLKQ